MLNGLSLWSNRRPVTPATAEALHRVDGLQPAVVITGGSRGIGLALAKCFAKDGLAVVLVARDASALAAAADALQRGGAERVLSLPLDITQSGAFDTIGKALAEASLYLDILINSAGIGLAGPFLEHTPAKIDRLLAVNIDAVTQLTRAALPGMLARRRGGVLNVASLGGYTPGPHQAAYYASKSYVISLTEAIAAEVSGYGVRVAVLAPGPVDTEFHAAMGAEHALYRRVLPSLSAQRVAESGYRGFHWGQRVIVPGLFAKLNMLVLRALPHPFTVPFVSVLLRRGGVR